jgi:parallel beta-helix repeat protein
MYLESAGGTARQNVCGRIPLASGFRDWRSRTWKATPARTIKTAAFCTGGLPGVSRGRMSAGRLPLASGFVVRPAAIGGQHLREQPAMRHLYSDSAGGTARRNVCRQNGYHGVGVDGQAQPQLEANTCENNKYSGIAYFDSAGARRWQNVCRQNGYHGIGVQGQAQPQLEGNTCETINTVALLTLILPGARRGRMSAAECFHGIGVQDAAAIGGQHLREQPAMRHYVR